MRDAWYFYPVKWLFAAFQYVQDQGPDPLNWAYAETLIGSMDPFHGGPQRYTVEVRSLLGEEPALETAVDSGDDRIFSVRAFAALGDSVAKYRFAPEFPGGVRAA